MKKDARKGLKRRVDGLEALVDALAGRIEAVERRVGAEADGGAAAAAVENGPLVCAMTVKVSAAGRKAFEEAAAAAGDTVPEAMRTALAAYIAAAGRE